MGGISDEAFASVAQMLGCEEAAIRAVAEVESSGSGFLPDGQPKILFERHIFRRELQKRGYDTDAWEAREPNLVNAKPGGYWGGAREHDRLAAAVAYHREAALSSASWGRFQIMGFNWKAAGYPSLQAFINAMYASEDQHLVAFARFIMAHPPMQEALRNKDWAEFARRYNGPAYARNQYDVKMQRAYEKWNANKK